MSNQTGWYLVSGVLPNTPWVTRIPLQTGRWSAGSIIHNTFLALSFVSKEGGGASEMAEYLLEASSAQAFKITNTDGPVVVVDFDTKLVSLFEDDKPLVSWTFEEFLAFTFDDLEAATQKWYN